MLKLHDESCPEIQKVTTINASFLQTYLSTGNTLDSIQTILKVAGDIKFQEKISKSSVNDTKKMMRMFGNVMTLVRSTQ